MSWALIGLKLMGIGRAIMEWLSRRSAAELACIALAIYAALSTIGYKAEQRHARHLSAQLSKCMSAREADQRAYAKAQADAAARNRAHVETENKLREQINEASRNSFVADRDRLRAQSGAAKSSPGTAAVPQVPHAAPGTPPEVVSLPPAELLRAQETELQLNALIDWVLQQSKIDPNTGAAH